MLIIILILIFILLFAYSGSSQKRFLLVRHAERLDSKYDWESWILEHKHWYDTPITDNMEPLEKFYGKNPNIRFHKIYTSPFTRCIQTALLIRKHLGGKAEIYIEPGIIEQTSLQYYIYNPYFSIENIRKRLGAHLKFKPLFDEEALKSFIFMDPKKSIETRLHAIMEHYTSGIMVTHRDFLIVSGAVDTDYCGSIIL